MIKPKSRHLSRVFFHVEVNINYQKLSWLKIILKLLLNSIGFDWITKRCASSWQKEVNIQFKLTVKTRPLFITILKWSLL